MILNTNKFMHTHTHKIFNEGSRNLLKCGNDFYDIENVFYNVVNICL